MNPNAPPISPEDSFETLSGSITPRWFRSVPWPLPVELPVLSPNSNSLTISFPSQYWNPLGLYWLSISRHDYSKKIKKKTSLQVGKVAAREHHPFVSEVVTVNISIRNHQEHKVRSIWFPISTETLCIHWTIIHLYPLQRVHHERESEGHQTTGTVRRS